MSATMLGAGVAQGPAETLPLRAFKVTFKDGSDVTVTAHGWTLAATSPEVLAIVFITKTPHEDHYHESMTRALTNVTSAEEQLLPAVNGMLN